MINKNLKIKKPTIIIPETSTDQWDLRLDFEFPEIDAILAQVESIYVEDNQTSGNIIRGGWGTGKTHFRKYLKNIAEKYNSLLVESSMSKICNVYEDKNKKYSKLIYNHSNPSARFIAAFFISAEENKLIPHEYLQDFSLFQDPTNFIRKYLEFFINKKNFSTLTLYIDEMEELGDRLVSNEVLQDLASIFNEESMLWGANKQFGGKLKLYLSCTPQAYEKLKTNTELEQNLGKIEGRMKFLELPLFSRKVGLEFIFAFYKHFFDKDCDTYPFDSISTLHSLVFFSRQNFRNLMDLLTEPIRQELYISSESEKIRIYTSLNLFEFLYAKKFEVQITGQMKSPLINEENFKNLDRIIRKNIKNEIDYKTTLKLLKLVLSNLKPLSLNEISEMLRLEDIEISTDLIYGKIASINKYLEKLDIDGIQISKYHKINEEKIENPAFNTFKHILSDVLEDDFVVINQENQEFIQIGKKQISSREFANFFLFYNFPTDFTKLSQLPSIIEEIYFPIDLLDYEVILPKINESKIKEMLKKLDLRAIKDEFNSLIEYFMPNYNLISYIYPEPIPKFLSHIKQPKKINEIIENSRNDLEILSNEYFSSTFSNYLKFLNSEDFKIIGIEIVDCDGLKLSELKISIKYNNRIFEINVWLIFKSILNDTDFDKISILYKDEIEKNKKKISNTTILPHFICFSSHQQIFFNDYEKFPLLNPYQIIRIQLTQDYYRRFVMLHLALKLSDNNEDMYRTFRSEDLNQLDLKNKIINILNDQEIKKTNDIFIIKNLVGINSKSFIQILSWFINCDSKNLTLEQIWEWNNANLRSFQVFGTKLSTLGMHDYDSYAQLNRDEISPLIDLLYISESKNEEKFSLIEPPIEKRILDIYAYYENFNRTVNQITSIDLKRFFLIENKDKLFDDLYLEILIRKGKLYYDNKKKSFGRQDLEELKKVYEKLFSEITDKLSKISLDIIYTSKKDTSDYRVIKKSKLSDFLNNTSQQLKKISSERLNSSIIIAENIKKKLIEDHFNKGEKELKNLNSKIKNLNYDVIYDFFDSLKYYIDIPKNSKPTEMCKCISEIQDIEDLITEISYYLGNEISRKEFIDKIDKNNYTPNNREQFPYCLPQLELTKNTSDKIFKFFNPIKDYCSDNIDQLRSFNENINSLRNICYKITDSYEGFFNIKSIFTKLINILGKPKIKKTSFSIDEKKPIKFRIFREMIDDKIISKTKEYLNNLEYFKDKILNQFKDLSEIYSEMIILYDFLDISNQILESSTSFDHKPIDELEKLIENGIEKFSVLIDNSANYQVAISIQDELKDYLFNISRDISAENKSNMKIIQSLKNEISELEKILDDIEKYKIENIENPIDIITEILNKYSEYLLSITQDIESINLSIKSKSWDNIDKLILGDPFNFEEQINSLEIILDELKKNKELTDDEIIEEIPDDAKIIDDIIRNLAIKFEKKVPHYGFKDWALRLIKIWRSKKISMYLSKIIELKENSTEIHENIDLSVKKQVDIQNNIDKNLGKDNQNKSIVILDGANIARNNQNSKTADILDVIKCRDELVKLGVDKNQIFIIFGSSLRHYLKENQKEIFSNLLKEYNVNQAPAGKDDDWFIIKFAQRNNAFIVTNDYYKEYRNEHPELQKFLSSNSIRYTCIGGQIDFEEGIEEKLK